MFSFVAVSYTHLCDFKDVVISLKSSDCRTMVDAVRLLVEKMEAEGMCYPLHLGVTEAGEGEDGRIRSAVGIGTLLNEGIGDTIRVSLTEEPEAEIPVACELARICSEPEYLKGWTPLKGECSKPCIVAGLTGVTVLDEQVMNRIGFTVSEVNDPVYGDRLHAGIKAVSYTHLDVYKRQVVAHGDSVVDGYGVEFGCEASAFFY